MTNLRVLLIPAGSAGDVNPFAGLARRLIERGHAVTVACNGHFRPLFDLPGVRFIEIGDDELYERVVRHPDLWRRGPASMRVVMRLSAAALQPLFDVVREFVREPGAVVVCGVLALGARVARDVQPFPLATVQLAPVALPSLLRPAVLPGSPLRAWMPHWLKRGLWSLTNRVADTLCAEVIEFRGRFGLPPVRGVMTEWVNSPDCVLALFPPWFAAPPGDWPVQVRMTGFPLWDAEQAAPLAPAVEEWLARHEARGPIVFAPGSANAQAAGFFSAAVDACARMGRPGVLLTPFADQVPRDLPGHVARFDYVPLSRLLARVAALVSHGGIGTLSQGLAAGVPQLVMPMAFDQFDNLAHARSLGVARGLPRRFDGGRLARELELLLSDARVASAAADAARLVRADGDSLAATCDVIESLPELHAARITGSPA